MRVNLERKPVLLAIVLNLVNNSGANSEPGHSTKVELLHFRKNFILDVWLGSENTSATEHEKSSKPSKIIIIITQFLAEERWQIQLFSNHKK